MFKKLFQRWAGPAPIPGPLSLELTFLGVDPDANGVTIGWKAVGAPADVMFDVDFQGTISTITTGFIWDSESNVLKNVFADQSDAAFRIRAGWAYADYRMDGSGRVGSVWVAKLSHGPELEFRVGHAVSIEFEFDPSLKRIRTV